MAVDESNQTWADASDVLRLTGETVDDTWLTRAQGIIDLFSGITFLAYRNLSPRNVRHLTMATAYQAAWMPYHPDLFVHIDYSSASQDGASSTPAHDNASLVAPFAHRCLRRLTWLQKPLRVRRAYGNYDNYTPRDSAVADDNRIWTPMP